MRIRNLRCQFRKYLTSKFNSNLLAFRSICSTFGIEIDNNIYEIRPTREAARFSKKEICTTIKNVNTEKGSRLTQKSFSIYTSRKRNDVERLLHLHGIANQLEQNNVKYHIGYEIKGQIKIGNKTSDKKTKLLRNEVLGNKKHNITQFERAIIVGENGVGDFPDDQLTKRTFEWKQNFLRMKNDVNSTTDDSIFDFTTLEQHHPIFDSDYVPVFKTYQQTLEVLQKVFKFPVGKITFNQYIRMLSKSELMVQNEMREFMERTIHIKELPNVKRPLRNPFIVLEGLDGTGKSTMTKNLSNALNAVSMGTPPDSIRSLRKHFDKLPELLRRSFYSLSNYLVSLDVSSCTDNRPVVLDRYWHSTAAFAIAKEACGGLNCIPPSNHPLYAWPSDLFRPSAIVFLTTPELERDTRLNDRDTMTLEESEVLNSNKLRRRILESYQRIGFRNNWIVVDTSGTQEESLEKALNGLKRLGVI